MNQNINTDIEAEQAVLGSLIYRNDLMPEIASILENGSFFFDVRHANIYEAMLALNEAGNPFDETLLADQLEKSSVLQAVGGLPYLNEITQYASNPDNAEHYAKIVKEQWTKREIAKAGKQIQAATDDKSINSTEHITNAQAMIEGLVLSEANEGLSHIKEASVSAFEMLEVLSSNESEISGKRTGLEDLDKITHGFQDSNLIVLAARPAMGKSAVALNIAAEIAKTKLVPFFSLEMSKEELVNRILSFLGKIDATKLKTGQLEPSDWDKISLATNELNSLNLFIDDRASLSYQQIINECKKLSKKGEIGAVFIDYLQLVKGVRKNQPREQEIAEISRSFKRLAKELKVPVVALSQLNRSLESRSDKRPMMSDLRESGAIEQDADLIMFIYRDEVYDKESDDKGKAEIIIGKHRNGSTGTVFTQFIGKYTKFSNLRNYDNQQYGE